MKNKNWILYSIIFLLVAYIGYSSFYKSDESNFISEKLQEFNAESSNDIYASAKITNNDIIEDFSLILDNPEIYLNQTVTLRGEVSNFASYGLIKDSNGEVLKIELKRSRKFEKAKTIKVTGVVAAEYELLPNLEQKIGEIYLKETNILKN